MGADSTIDTLSIEIDANASKSVDGIKALSRALGSLSRSIEKVNGAGISNVAAQTQRLRNAFQVSGSAAEKTSVVYRKYSSSLSSITKHSGRASSSSKSMAYYFGKMYANCFLAIRGMKKLGSAINSSMDFIETVDYYGTVVNKIGSQFSDQFAKYGYDSAESYKKSFNDRMQNLSGKMTGFTFDMDGNTTATGQKSMNLDVNELTDYQANVMAVTNSLGLCGEASVNTAKALSMLTADESSLRNVDLTTVMNNFTSGLIGQSRALYKYGIDITNATLQNYALANGVSKSVSSMSQSEKIQLRLLAILDQSRVAWGNLSDTINTPANQLRVLKQNFKNLARVIGNLFMPIVSKVLPYVNALVIALQRLFTYVAGVFGIDLSGISAGIGSANDAYSDLVDDSDDFKDSTDKANKSAKALKNTIMGYDEINKRNDASDTSKGSSSGGGGSSIDLSDQISDALGEYEKVWNKAFDNMQNKAETMADKICTAFKNHDYTGIGTYISTGLTKALNGINWNKVYSVASKFGSGLAQFLNGLITPELFSAIGGTIAGAINTAIATSKAFAKDFDFTNLGVSVGAAVNTCLRNIKWSDALESAKLWGKGIGSTLNGFLKTTDFTLVGSTVAQFLNTAITGALSLGVTIDWKQFGKDIGDSISGFFRTFDFNGLATTLNTWVDGIETAIGEALKTISWKDVLKGTMDFLGTLNIDTITVGLGTFLLTHNGVEITKTVLKTLIGDELVGKLAETFGNNGKYSVSGFVIKASIAVTVAIGGFSLGKEIGKKMFPEDADLYDNFKWSDFTDAVKYFFTDELPQTMKRCFTDFQRWFFLQTTLGQILAKSGLAEKLFGVNLDDLFKDQSTTSNGKGGGGRKLNDEGESIISNGKGGNGKKIGQTTAGVTATISAQIRTNKQQAQKNVNSTVSKVNSSGKTSSLLSNVKTDSKKDSSKIVSNTQKSVSKLDPIQLKTKSKNDGKDLLQKIQNDVKNKHLSINAKTSNTGNDLRNDLQKKFGLKNLLTGSSVTNTGTDLRNQQQSTFGLKDLKTGSQLTNSGTDLRKKQQSTFGLKNLKTGSELTNTGNSLRKVLQLTFGMKNLKTAAEVTNSGNSLRKGLQDTFGLYDLHTGSYVTNSGDSLRQGLQDTFGSKNLSTGVNLPDGWAAFSSQWEVNKKTLTAGISMDVQAKSDGKLLVPNTLTSMLIRGFASGGFPQSGQLFMARENGINEMVGHIGSKPSVANNDQIVDGITAGVARGMMEVVMATNGTSGGSSGQPVEIPVYLDGREITRATCNNMDQMIRSGQLKPVWLG